MKSDNLTLLLVACIFVLLLVSFYYHCYFKEHFSVPVAPGTELLTTIKAVKIQKPNDSEYLGFKAADIKTGSDLENRAIKCIEAGFPSDKKTASYEDLTSEINKLSTELRALCFDLLELKPTNAITFKPCKKFY